MSELTSMFIVGQFEGALLLKTFRGIGGGDSTWRQCVDAYLTLESKGPCSRQTFILAKDRDPNVSIKVKAQ